MTERTCGEQEGRPRHGFEQAFGHALDMLGDAGGSALADRIEAMLDRMAERDTSAPTFTPVRGWEPQVWHTPPIADTGGPTDAGVTAGDDFTPEVPLVDPRITADPAVSVASQGLDTSVTATLFDPPVRHLTASLDHALPWFTADPQGDGTFDGVAPAHRFDWLGAAADRVGMSDLAHPRPHTPI